MTSEKRILIRESRPECKFRELHETTAGGLSWIDYLCGNPSIIDTNRECDDKRIAKCKCKELNGISRQEAIERINHAICVEIHGPCDICEQIKGGNEGHCNDYKKYAEAALNALLDTPTLEERVEEITKNNPGIPDYDKFYKALREGK